MKRVLIVGLAALAVGCSSVESHFPLSLGEVRTYTVKTGFSSYVAEVEVTRRVPVFDQIGYEVGGRMGWSRLAWRKGRLIAEELPNSRFSPPVPLLVPDEVPPPAKKGEVPSKGIPIPWKGTIWRLGRPVPAEASLVQDRQILDTGTRKIDTLHTVLKLSTANDVIELESWFAEKGGLVRQENRVNGLQSVSLELLGSP